MNTLTVFYDDACALCVRCRAWMEDQAALMPLTFVSCHSIAARELRTRGVPVGEVLVVADDEGRVWVGAAAFIVCLWALAEYRDLAITLSDGLAAWLAGAFFALVERQRPLIARVFLPAGECTADACGAPPYRLGP